MVRGSRDDPRAVGRSVAIPLAGFGLLALVVGILRQTAGEGGAALVVLAGVVLLVGAVAAMRLAGAAKRSE